MSSEQIVPSMDNPFHTADEVAAIFAVTPATVRIWLKDGTIKGVKLPTGGWRILHTDMVKFANERYGSV